jgi:uncharacterized protein YciI
MTLGSRRRFMGLTLGVASALGWRARADAPSQGRPVYLVVYRLGPAWVPGKPSAEQPGMRDHFEYYLDLYRKGRLQAGGGFADGSGGAAIFEAHDDAAAKAFLAADPAVVSGAFAYDLKRWRPNRWDEISKAREARGK